jgi:serine/threonine protein kinase
VGDWPRDWDVVELEPNTLLAGRYRITDVLAEGGMGVVYRAQDQRLDRLVAIKTVRYQDRNLVIRLRREAQLLARLTHPNVVSLYDVGEHEGRPYLVTQFVDGVPLRRLLGRMTERRVAWVAEQIANGLAAAHSLGIVHRDLKPSNVLVGDGTVRLLDFGIARHINDAALTRTESLLGTAAYISPEQLAGQPAGPGADIYALGLVLIEGFSGRAAFPGTFAETVATRMIARPDLPDELPPAWHGLVAAMTDTTADARPSALQVAATVRALGRPGADAGSMPVAGSGTDGDPPVDPRRVPLPAAVDSLPPQREIEPLPANNWDEQPLHQRGNPLTRPAVVWPAAALAAVVLVAIATVGMLSAGGTGGSAEPIVQSVGDQPTGPVSTLPVTESAPPTTLSPEVLAAEAAATATTAPVVVLPPPLPPPTVAPPASPPPTPGKPPPTRAPTTTRPRTTTTLNEFQRWLCRWSTRC